jgi:hypothetical protein
MLTKVIRRFAAVFSSADQRLDLAGKSRSLHRSTSSGMGKLRPFKARIPNGRFILNPDLSEIGTIYRSQLQRVVELDW